MVTALRIFMVVAMLATLGVLVAGLVGLARGSDPRRSNKLMQWRIGLQALALLFAVILLSLHRHMSVP